VKIAAVIPARFGSSRFEGKPLADIDGVPMIAWVYYRVQACSHISQVLVATDDERIANACAALGLSCVMTASTHVTSTERLYEIAQKVDAELYVCVNGDEPLIDLRHIEAVIPDALPSPDEIYVANLATKIATPAEVLDATNIKVVFSSDGHAQFMSRAAIPYPKNALDFDYYKHVGVLIYNRAALEFFVTTERGTNERIEDINELRFIENGVALRMILVEPGRGLSVDTPKDLERIRSIVAEEGITARPGD
jgi:3-deoxy-manno-octulosonate cytidylyltransferase (CMP-KDO synthetase)